jgi:hypothetical protein
MDQIIDAMGSALNQSAKVNGVFVGGHQWRPWVGTQLPKIWWVSVFQD